jgi:hypothetical protein
LFFSFFICPRNMVWKLPVVVVKMSFITNEGFEGHAWNPTHESLKYAHRITLRGQDAGPSTAHGQGTVLADVAVTTKGGARLLPNITPVARVMPAGREWRQP